MSEFDDIELDDIELDFDDTPEEPQATKPPVTDISDTLDIDDLDLDESVEETKVVDEDSEHLETVSKEINEKKAPESIEIDDDLEIDLEEESKEIQPEPVVEKPKRGRKKADAKEPKAAKPEKKTKEKEPEVVETDVSIRFDPAFDVSPENLDTKTYQIRKTKRSSGDIQDLKSRIEAQGQVEPIQVVVKDGKNYLIAGEGRVLALRQLNMKAKALVYTGLNDEEILKTSFGSNEGRLEMSEWDRLVSIGEYYDQDTGVSKDDLSDPKSIISIFGLNKSSIYNYLKLWAFFKEKQVFHDFFGRFRCPLYVLTGTVEVLKDYESDFDSWKPIVEILTTIVKRNDLSRKTFTNVFLKEITDLLLQVRMAKNVIEIENEPLDDPELAKLERQTKKEINSKLKLDESEKIQQNIEKSEENKTKAETAENLLKDIDKNLESVIMLLGELDNVDGFHSLVHTDNIKNTMAKVSKVNQLISILV